MRWSEQLEDFYSADSPEIWKKVLGDALHYHYGYYIDNETSFEEAQLQAIRNFYPHIEQGSHVLDAGCGWGGPAQLITNELGCTVTGVTISKSQYDYCRSLGLDVVRDDLEVMDFKSMKYDLIMMIESLGHIRNKQKLLDNARKIAPKLLLRTNCVSNLRSALAQQNQGWFGNFETPETICRRLEKAGWKVISMVNRRSRAGLTQVHWQQRLKAAFGDSPPIGHLEMLGKLCEYSLSAPEDWEQACPLIDIVAE